MVNQKYIKNECETKVIQKQNIDNNIVYFSKFFGEDAFSKALELLKLKASGQKVLFLVPNEEYEKYMVFKSDDFEPILIPFVDNDIVSINNIMKSFDESINYIFVIGGENEISTAKYIAFKNNLQIIGFINKFVTLDAFTPYSYCYENNIIHKKGAKCIDFLFIDNNELIKNTNREMLTDCVFNIISKLGLLLENYINCCIFKDNGFNTYIEDFINIFKKLDKFLHTAIDLSSEDILTLMDINIEFSSLLNKMNYDGEDKESKFSLLYNYIDKKTPLTINALKAIGVQVFVKLYKDFMLKIDNIGNTFFDIENRVTVFDNMFKHTDLEFDLGEIVTNKQTYLLYRFKEKILDKINAINNLVDKLMYKTLDLFSDSGYSFLKDINEDVVLKSVYFTADIVNQNNLLKIMRNLGVLDFYNIES